MKVGDAVLMTVANAKWHLDHPEVYEYRGGYDEEHFEIETMIHLMCALGAPVVGVVTGMGSSDGVWLVRFQIEEYVAEYHVEEEKHVLSYEAE